MGRGGIPRRLRPALPAATRATPRVSRRTAPQRSRSGVLATVLALTWLNPHVYLDTVLLVGSLANQHGADGRWWFAGGAAARERRVVHGARLRRAPARAALRAPRHVARPRRRHRTGHVHHRRHPRPRLRTRRGAVDDFPRCPAACRPRPTLCRVSTGEVAAVGDDKRMRLRYAGTCRECGTDPPSGHPCRLRADATHRALPRVPDRCGEHAARTHRGGRRAHGRNGIPRRSTSVVRRAGRRDASSSDDATPGTDGCASASPASAASSSP